MGSLKTCSVVLLASVAFCSRSFAADATVTFTFDFPGSNPSHYEIVVNSEGRGSYTSNGQLSHDSEPADPEALKITVSENVRTQIFELAKKAHYFDGHLDSGRKNLANTGNKVLTYKDSSHNSQATYNYSPVQPVQDLTSIFQS